MQPLLLLWSEPLAMLAPYFLDTDRFGIIR